MVASLKMILTNAPEGACDESSMEDPESSSTRVSSIAPEIMRMLLSSPIRRYVSGVSSTSARPDSVTSVEPSLSRGNVPDFGASGWPSRKTTPSKKLTNPERAEITDCPEAWGSSGNRSATAKSEGLRMGHLSFKHNRKEGLVHRPKGP